MAGPGPARGTVTITGSSGGGETLIADISGYETEWKPRKRVIQGLGGASVTQDFGRYAKDLEFTIRSAGTAGYITSTQLLTLDQIMGVRGALPTYADSLGTSATITILEFPRTRERADFFSYQMRVKVQTLTYYLGSSYGGS